MDLRLYGQIIEVLPLTEQIDRLWEVILFIEILTAQLAMFLIMRDKFGLKFFR